MINLLAEFIALEKQMNLCSASNKSATPGFYESVVAIWIFHHHQLQSLLVVIETSLHEVWSLMSVKQLFLATIMSFVVKLRARKASKILSNSIEARYKSISLKSWKYFEKYLVEFIKLLDKFMWQFHRSGGVSQVEKAIYGFLNGSSLNNLQ